MGYDMYWKRPPSEALQATRARASADFHAACAERDALPRDERGTWQSGDEYDQPARNAGERYKLAQKKVSAAYEAMMRAEVNYFRLNLWGMDVYRRLMEDLGVGYWPSDQPDWPENPFEGEILEDYWAFRDWEAEELVEYDAKYPDRLIAFRAHREQVDAHLAWVPEGGIEHGINLDKFGSNDGWHVLPEECNAALRIIRDIPRERLEEAFRRHYPGLSDMESIRNLWQSWVHFLTGAEYHGGFEVN